MYTANSNSQNQDSYTAQMAQRRNTRKGHIAFPITMITAAMVPFLSTILMGLFGL